MRKPKNKDTKSYQIWLTWKQAKDALKLWRKRALERAAYRCEWCGFEGKGLNVHHILTKRIKELRTDDNNSLVLCPRCHKLGILGAHSNPVRVAIWLMENRPIAWQYLKEISAKLVRADKQGYIKKAFNKSRDKSIPEYQDSTGDGS